MTEKIGRPEPADKTAVRALWESCFSEGQPVSYTDWYFEKVYREDISLCFFIEGTLASSLQMVPYTLSLRGKATLCNTLSSVSTGEAFRRRGLARKLMASALDDMASRGLGFTFLYPFDHGFYERLGWAACSNALEYRLSGEELPDRPPVSYTARILESPDVPVLSKLYDRWTSGRNCASIRNETDWLKRIGEYESCGGFVVLAECRGEPCGYAIAEVESGELNAYELVSVAPGATQAILSALKPMGFPVRFIAPADDRTYVLPGRWFDRVRLQPHVMFRVTDVPLAFAQAAPACDGDVILEVSGDNMRPENNGVYFVKVENGKASAERTDGNPQFSCDIVTLVRILTGYMDAKEAMDAGLATGESKAAKLLAEMYPRQRNFLFELY